MLLDLLKYWPQWEYQNAFGRTVLTNNKLSKYFYFQNKFTDTSRWCFFLTEGGGLSILESIMSNDMKYACVYRVLQASLSFLLRRMAACFEFLFFHV